MQIDITFQNRQLIDGETKCESSVESVGVHANGLTSESVAFALMTAIDCLFLEPIGIVYWLVQNLPDKEQKSIKRAIVCEAGASSDHEAAEIAAAAVSRLNRDEQEKIATDILSQWGKCIVSSVVTTSARETTNEPM